MMTISTTACTDTLVAPNPIRSLPTVNDSKSNGGTIVGGKRLSDVKKACRTETTYTSPAIGRSWTVRNPSMPVSTGSQSLLASLPSFASVFGDEPSGQPPRDVTTATTQPSSRPVSLTKRPGSAHQLFSASVRRNSASTFESVESSPTTTISTAESFITEPSPSSSPETPDSVLSPNSLKSYRTHSSPAINSVMDSKERFSNSFPLLPGVDRAESPNKKMRNMKNLSVNTAMSNRSASQLSKLALSNAPSQPAGQASSAPPTPAFIVPPKAPRKKPSNLGLSITTPGSGPSTNSPSQGRPSAVPQTPSDPQIPTFRYLQTTNSGPLFSPTHAPEGGMRLPPISSMSPSSRCGKPSRPPLSISPLSSFDASISSPIVKQTLDQVQEETDYDVPLSQEVKSPAYPQGPICIYDPNVYLYLEPTQVEARAFDVIFNVAREVKNPFLEGSNGLKMRTFMPELVSEQTEQGSGSLAGRDLGSDLPASQAQILPENLPPVTKESVSASPSTYTANTHEPEYIHIPWDHNTNVVEDLLRLCEVIDERVRQNKRVLIHCQCGVSRSASLVVAYGLYRNPQLTVQEAYDAVKTRSRWIGPNMNLIYQLSEFKSKLRMKASNLAPLWQGWRQFGPRDSTADSTLSSHIHPQFTRSGAQKSLSAPTPAEHTPGVRAKSFSSSNPVYLDAKPTTGDITPGPSSAPPNMAWLAPEHPMETVFSITPTEMKSSHDFPPTRMDLDVAMSFSPITVTGPSEPGRTEIPPGAVAKDLSEVAEEMEARSTPDIARGLLPTAMEIDSTPRATGAALNAESSDAKSSSPILPAGFTGLLTRRQGVQRLPVRQEPPRFQINRMPLPAFNPLLHDDVPPTPSLLSPRAAEFTASPFHRTAAGDLAGSSVFEQGLMSPTAMDEDPRSPHQRGEAPITRSIFDIIDKPQK